MYTIVEFFLFLAIFVVVVVFAKFSSLFSLDDLFLL